MFIRVLLLARAVLRRGSRVIVMHPSGLGRLRGRSRLGGVWRESGDRGAGRWGIGCGGGAGWGVDQSPDE